MTTAQRKHFFADLWRPACERMGWPHSDRDFRLAKVGEWLGRELTTTDKLNNRDFDKIKGECLAIIHPANMDEQIKQAEMPLTRLRTGIAGLAPGNLIETLVQERFSWSTWLLKKYPEAGRVTLKQAPVAVVAEYRDSGFICTLEDMVEWQLVELRQTLERIMQRRFSPPSHQDHQEEAVPF